MSEEASTRDTLSIMVTKLIMVMLGFVILILSLTGLGYLGNAYYTARRDAEQFEIIKQDAFTRGLSAEQYLKMQRNNEQMGEAAFERYMATLESERGAGGEDVVQNEPESAMPARPLAIPSEKILPPPDVDVTPADLEAMKGKAVLIHTTVGTIVVELYPQLAPRTCKNFLYLVENRFYDGLYFHRNQPGVYIQAGSPTGWRGASAGYWTDMEHTGSLPLVGTVAALPSVDDPKISSEFIMFVGSGTSYSGQVTVFGRVIDRFDVAEKIADTRFDQNGYSFERTYIRTMEIVDADSVRPEEDFWASYGKD